MKTIDCGSCFYDSFFFLNLLYRIVQTPFLQQHFLQCVLLFCLFQTCRRFDSGAYLTSLISTSTYICLFYPNRVLMCLWSVCVYICYCVYIYVIRKQLRFQFVILFNYIISFLYDIASVGINSSKSTSLLEENQKKMKRVSP